MKGTTDIVRRGPLDCDFLGLDNERRTPDVWSERDVKSNDAYSDVLSHVVKASSVASFLDSVANSRSLFLP